MPSGDVKYRRPQRPTARRDVVDAEGSVIRKGERIPKGAIPLKHLDALGSHGYVDRRKGDDGIDTG